MLPLAVILYLLECDYFGYGASFATNFVDSFLSAVGDSTQGTALGSSRFPSLVLVNTYNRNVMFPNDLLVLPHNACIDEPAVIDGIAGGMYAGFDPDLLVLLENFRVDKTCRENIAKYLLSIKNNPQHQQPASKRAVGKK